MSVSVPLSLLGAHARARHTVRSTRRCGGDADARARVCMWVRERDRKRRATTKPRNDRTADCTRDHTDWRAQPWPASTPSRGLLPHYAARERPQLLRRVMDHGVRDNARHRAQVWPKPRAASCLRDPRPTSALSSPTFAALFCLLHRAARHTGETWRAHARVTVIRNG